MGLRFLLTGSKLTRNRRNTRRVRKLFLILAEEFVRFQFQKKDISSDSATNLPV